MATCHPWDKKLIVDEATNQCHAQFSADGIVTLKEIDLGNGRVKREMRLVGLGPLVQTWCK